MSLPDAHGRITALDRRVDGHAGTLLTHRDRISELGMRLDKLEAAAVIEELAIVRNVQPHDLLIVTVPADTKPEAAHHLGIAVKDAVGCKVIVKSADIEIASA